MTRRPRKSTRRLWRGKAMRLAGGGALLIALAVALVWIGPTWARNLPAYVIPERVALRTALQAPGLFETRHAYAQRRYRPLWIRGGKARPEALALVRRLETSADEGLAPASYEPTELRRLLEAAPDLSRAERARAELRLSAVYGDYIVDLHTPVEAAEVAYTDPDFTHGRPSAGAALLHLARARSTAEGVEAATRLNPLYEAYRAALTELDAKGTPDPAVRQALLLNMERMRALPAKLGRRFVLVDVASARLWLYENDRPVDSMKVIVGAHDQPTPSMAALIRYAVYNPSWNVPSDLTQKTYAPRFVANPRAIEALQMDVWSNHTRQARLLKASDVNWTAVAQGHQAVWLRQRPGPHNAMGEVKFMLPNVLGIYLHDTADKSLFAADQRTFSAGCIRVEDYRRLARWLYGREVGPRGPAADQRIDLPQPVPVYITYLTAAPNDGLVELRRDVYGWDAKLVASIEQGVRRSAPQPDADVQNASLERSAEASPGLTDATFRPIGPAASAEPKEAPVLRRSNPN